MGLRKKIIKKLPIFGRGQAQAAESRVSQTPVEARKPETVSAPKEVQDPRGGLSAVEYIEQVISENKVVLFMKGSPDQPLCGFSANAAGILASTGRAFAHVDVIADYEVRESIKDFSQWPTLPQIYIGGEFVGGSDILRQMSTDGSLVEMLDAAFAEN